jgi:gas vesicle protein
MAEGYDRSNNDSNGGGSFVMGLLTGTVLGAGLGMLFAPKAGAELRNQVREQAGNLANTASDGYRRAAETAGQYAERGRDMANRAAETAGQYAERGRDMANDLAGRAREAVVKGTEEAQRYVREATAGSSDMIDKIASTTSSGTSSSAPPGPRPAGSYTGSTSSADSMPHPGGSHSGSGGFGA